MATHEGSTDERAKIIAAGHAAASWVRARRATWTDAPLGGRPAPLAQPLPAPAPVHVEPKTFEPPEPPELPAPAEPREPAGPPLSERAGEWIESAREPAARWLPRLVAAAALAGVAIVGGPYVYRLLSRAKASAARPAATATPPAGAPRRSTGALSVRSTPDGARVLVDGTARGTTPVTLDVAVGRHTIVLESPAGTIERSVTVTGDGITEVDESIFSGFVTIYSPFEVVVTEGARALRPDDRNEIMLPAGRHDLRITNRSLGFDEVRQVDLKPGQRATISIGPQRSTISVTATEPGEVLIDGTRLGDTPVADAPLDVGTHVVVVRRAAGGERRFTITATVKPVVLHVDFSRP